ncbi:hypothetical protein QCA50_010667 [Cerrena zonata]|uniref:Aminoglycoside phosphotransferase domain-containing protein n=1 Tax=Cerrena zonata TaxID=2478898 RepID=A0AAW0FZE2_9APHY
MAVDASIAKLSLKQISDFFSRNPGTMRQECDGEAERITGVSVHPTPVQGGGSYTVIGGTLVVQFRSGEDALDLQFLGYIEQAYAGFVPERRSNGTLGKLHVYTMNDMGGISMYLARERLFRDDCHLLRQTLQDYARFFASAWHNTPAQMTCPSRESLSADYSSQLSQFSQGLPSRFRPTLEYLISRLPSLFADDWPLVPNHTDLLENNIHVDPDTGRITGICDWKDAEISPFGMSLGGLETMLGIWQWEDGWWYHANYQDLRVVFWTAFWSAMGSVSEEQKERVEVARLVSLFLAYGFEWDKDGNKVPASEGPGLKHLDAVVLDNVAGFFPRGSRPSQAV